MTAVFTPTYYLYHGARRCSKRACREPAVITSEVRGYRVLICHACWDRLRDGDPDFPPFDDINPDMPMDATILSVDNQHGAVCLWAMIDPDTPHQTSRIIEIFGTGHPIPEGQRKFIGTVIVESLVWHVFETI